jgi:putative two-component system response regulator
MNEDSAAIMVVDDITENLKLLSSLLKKSGYKVFALPRGDLALEAALKTPPDLVLLDVNMPGLNGYETCKRFKNNPVLKSIPILFISALNQPFDKVKAFKSGGVDYITKPFNFEEIKVRVNTHLQLRKMQIALENHNRYLEKQIQEQVRQITESQMETIFALAKMAELRDLETGLHLERVRLLSLSLAQEIQNSTKHCDAIDDLYIDALFNASPLHDIGKIGVRDSVLQKPDKLTDDEYAHIKTHTTIGANTLRMVLKRFPHNNFIVMGVEIAQSHHEHWDGSGYPEGLRTIQIPLSARIVSLVDVYDALRSKRHYKSAISFADTCDIITDNKEKQFDPDIVNAFKRISKKFDAISKEFKDSDL